MFCSRIQHHSLFCLQKKIISLFYVCDEVSIQKLAAVILLIVMLLICVMFMSYLTSDVQERGERLSMAAS